MHKALPFTVNTVAEIELSYIPKQKNIKTTFDTSQTAFNFIWTLFDLKTVNLIEEVIVLFFNRGHKLIGYVRHSKGGISGTVLDKRLILATALKCGSSSIIVSHNHPSGNLMPSIQDKACCREIKEGCKYLGLNLLDFLIIAAVDYDTHAEPDGYSFADNGEL